VSVQEDQEMICAPILFDAISAILDASTTVFQQSSGICHQQLRVSFWLGDAAFPVHVVVILFPIGWTNRMYLAALKLSIDRKSLIVCDSEARQCRLNDVHLLFTGSVQNATLVLESQNAFWLVRGGESPDVG
jgi:hypothetical protein